MIAIRLKFERKTPQDPSFLPIIPAAARGTQNIHDFNRKMNYFIFLIKNTWPLTLIEK